MPKSFQKFLIFSFLGIFFLANISFGMMDFQKKDRNTGSTTFSPSSQNLQVSPLKVSDIKNELPKPEFLSLNFGEKISGEKEILVKIPSAQRVEFYLRSPSSLTEIYLGGGQIEKEDTWRFLLNSTNVPNGIYFLFLKVETSFGVYNTPEIQIEVFNEPQFQPEKIEEVKKEFEEKLEILSEK
ncbi:hypothetical protein H5T58_00560, partial [Candidatus Parcubacteria bacterium]|nr:hypothetical protein [Candidatus Parcubacteria bacterium]